MPFLPLRSKSGLVEVKIPIDLPAVPRPDKKSFVLLYFQRGINLNQNNADISFLRRMMVSYTVAMNEEAEICNPYNNNYRYIFVDFPNLINGYCTQDQFEKTWLLLKVLPCSQLILRFLVDTGTPEFIIHAPNLNLSCSRMQMNPNTIAIGNAVQIDLGGGETPQHPVGGPVNPNDVRVIAIDFGNKSSVAAIQTSNNPLPGVDLIHLDSVVALRASDVPVGGGGVPSLCVGTANRAQYLRGGISFATGGQYQGYNTVTREPASIFPEAHKFPKRALSHPDAEIDLSPNFDDTLPFSVELLKVHKNLGGATGPYFRAPKRLPAELFLTDLLERISAWEITGQTERVGTPQRLVVTHPTTAMKKEIIALKRGFARAFLRRMDIYPFGGGNFVITDEKVKNALKISDLSNDKGIVDDLIDEASAAAYYVIRKYLIAEDSCGTRGFHILHPEGTRIIIVDCGAGTTDVASFLVKTRNDHAGGGNHLVLDVSLTKLTGGQGFCGDLITRHVARLVRAKLFVAFGAPLNNPIIQLGNLSPTVSWANIADLKLKIDQVLEIYQNGDYPANFPLIDTIFQIHAAPNTGGMNNEDQSKRLSLFVGEAERIKEKLGEKLRKPPQQDAHGNGTLPLFNLDKAFINDIYKAGAQGGDIPDDLAGIGVYAEEVNQLICKDIERLARSINQAMLLPNGSDPDGVAVSSVILTGKGSLYPYLVKKLREDLSLLDPKNQVKELFELGGHDGIHGVSNLAFELKNCVAMGACWWFADKQDLAPKIQFTNDLAKLLPFDLCVFDSNISSYQIVFPTGTKYDDMVDPDLIKYPNSIIKPGNKITQLTLACRFPGNEELETYVTCTWNNPASEFKIAWNEKEIDFMVTAENMRGKLSRPKDGGNYYFQSPLWSGTL